MKKLSSPIAAKTSYIVLKNKVEAELLAGRKRAEDLVGRELARTNWNLGRHIEDHIKKEKPAAERAAYGKAVIERLAGDLKEVS